MQLQFEDGVGLNAGERLFGIELGRAARNVDFDFLPAEIGDQVFASVGAVGAGTNDDNHVIEVIERGEVAFENMFAVFRFRQQIRGAAANDIHPVIDKMLDGLNQPHFLWLPIYDSQENHGKTFLHRGVLEQLVKHDLGFAAALEFNDDAHAVAIAFIADIAYVVDDLVVNELSHALDQAGLVHLIGNFGDDDCLAVFVEGFDGGFGAHHEAAAAVFVGFEDSTLAVDNSGGREVWSLYDLQNLG